MSNVILEDFYINRPIRIYVGIAPTIRSERSGLKVVETKNERFQMFEISKDRICEEDS